MRVYYCSISYILLKLLLVTSPIIVAGLAAYLFFSGDSLLNPVSLEIIAAGLFILLISVSVYTRLFPVIVTEEGIIGHNARGQKQRLQWQELFYAGKVSNNGFPCHKLQSNVSARYVLIPVFLRRFKRLEAELKTRGLDLSAPPKPAQSATTAPTRRVRRARPIVEPRREGRYIVISTERVSKPE